MGSAWGSAATGEPAPGTAGWLADPWRRFAERWHEDGHWTSRVRTGAVGTSDPFPAGQNHAALPDAVQSEPTKVPGSKVVPKRALVAGLAVLAVVAVGLIVALVVIPGSATSSAKAGGEKKGAAERKATTTTTTIDVNAIHDRANLAVNKACLAQTGAGYVTNPTEGYDPEFQKASVSQEAYTALLTGCIGKNVQNSIGAAVLVPVDQVVRNPEAARGISYVMAAEITQFDSATGSCTFRATWDTETHEYSFEYAGDNAVFTSGDEVGYCPVLSGIDQGDVVGLWVKGLGSITYDTQMGGSLTVPKFQVLKVQLLYKN